MPYPYDDYPPPRHHRGSYHLNTDEADRGLRRSNSRGRPGPSEIHIHNDMYQEGPYADNRDYAMPSPPGRGRSPYSGYVEPGYSYPVQVMMPATSRSRSRGRYDEEYWRNRAIEDYKRSERERQEEKKRAIEEHELQQKKEEEDEKERQKEAVRKHEQDRKDKEEEQKRQWEEYEEKRKAKEREEKEKKEKEDEEFRERFRKTLSTQGFTQSEIDVMVEREKQKQQGTLVRLPSGSKEIARAPVFPKIRRTDIAAETLKYYDLKWRYDETDSKFIIIMQEMTERETDVLFAHTARLRDSGKATVLQIEDRGKGKKPEYMMVRRRSRSRGKSPSGRERLAEAVLRGPS